MIRQFALLSVFIVTATFSFAVTAQDSVDPDFEQRLELAKKMHEIKPVVSQIKDIVEEMAVRYPEDTRDAFKRRMIEVFDGETLTSISVQAMADTFTVAELEKMVDFHGSEEGKSISQKMVVYQALIQPELVKKIDQALMEVRTGKAAK